MDRDTVILVCVGSYMLLCVLIGLWAMRRTKTTHDFFMASRNLGVVITGVAMFSSIMSGFGFVGGPGLMYKMGMSSFWIVAAMPIGLSLAFFLLSKRLRLLAELRGAVSLADVAFARYNSAIVRLLVGVAILAGVVAYLAAQIKAMAIVLQQIFESNGIWGHESLVFCVAVSSAVLVFYCVTGGIIASVYTDLFQGVMMIVVAVLVFVAALTAFEGGITQVMTTIMRDDVEAAGPWGTLGIMGCLSWFFLFGFGVVGQPHVITKMMMSRRVEDARAMLPVTVIGYTVTALLWISIGLLMRAAVLNGSHAELKLADDAAVNFLYQYASPVLAGLTFAGLFAAIMSTADGFLNIGAAAIVHDVPRALFGRSLAHELLWARLATVALALFAAVFALVSPGLVGILGAYGWGVFASALVPVFGIGLNWKKATPAAAIASMVVSLAINTTAFTMKMMDLSIPYGISSGSIALLASLITFISVSHLSKSTPIAADVGAVMDI